MSSSQWEVVTKSKKQRNLEKKVEAHTEKKRLTAAGPKLEEILPSHAYKNIFTTNGKSSTSKEKKSPPKTQGGSNKSKSPKKTVAKPNTQPQKDQASNNDSKKVASVPRAKNLETGLQRITPEDLSAHLEHLKSTFPGSELLWLKGVAAYFNSNLYFDSDPVFSGKSILYPSNVVPKNLKNALIQILTSVGEVNLTYFYDTLLVSAANDLSKNQAIIGYKLLLQLIGQNWPEICSKNLAKTAILRNSYQNRSNIGLSILWSIGQGGFHDVNTGIKVWQNLMLPVLEIKSYSKYVTEYIHKVLSSASKAEKLNQSQNEFFLTYNALKAKYSISKECQQMLSESCELFLKKYIESCDKHSNLFLTLFREIDDLQLNEGEIESCIGCLIHGDDCFKVWKINYKKNVKQSFLLLLSIDRKWSNCAAELHETEAFDEFLKSAKQLNLELTASKRRDPYLDDLLSLFENVQEKSSQQKKKSSGKQCSGGCCKWMLGSIVLVALIGGIVAYDTHINGKGVFEKSAVGKVLKNAGLLPYVEKAWFTTMSTGARGYQWAEKHVPGYVRPIVQLTCDLYKIGRNAACNTCGILKEFAAAKWPVVATFLEQYIPGLSQKMENAYTSAQEASANVFESSVNFFKTQVFVGNFSPENLGKALNQTQLVAAEYFSWFHDKVDVYAKLK